MICYIFRNVKGCQKTQIPYNGVRNISWFRELSIIRSLIFWSEWPNVNPFVACNLPVITGRYIVVPGDVAGDGAGYRAMERAGNEIMDGHGAREKTNPPLLWSYMQQN